MPFNPTFNRVRNIESGFIKTALVISSRASTPKAIPLESALIIGKE